MHIIILINKDEYYVEDDEELSKDDLDFLEYEREREREKAEKKSD